MYHIGIINNVFGSSAGRSVAGASDGPMGRGRGHAGHLRASRRSGVLHLPSHLHVGDPEGPGPRRNLHHLHPHGLRAVLEDVD